MFFGNAISAYAQPYRSYKTEELTSLLENAAGVDRIEVLQELVWRIRHTDIDLAKSYANEALDFSKAYGQDSLEAESQLRIGAVANMAGKYIEAITHLDIATESFKELEFRGRENMVDAVLGGLYIGLGEFDLASELYFKSLEYHRSIGDERGEAVSLTRLGVIQAGLGDYRVAKRFFHDAIEKTREIGDWVSETIALSEAGLLEKEHGDPDKAVEYYEKAIALFERENIFHGVPMILFSIAEIYKDEERLDAALEVSERAMSLADSLSSKLLITDALVNHAGIYALRGDYEASNQVLERGLEISEESGIGSLDLKLLTLMASNYAALDNLDQAVRFGTNAYEVAKGNNDWSSSDQILNILIDAEMKAGNYEQAMGYQRDLMAVKDSIVNEETAKKIVELEVRYRVNEKEQAITALESEQEKQAIIQVALIVGLILIATLGILIYRSQRLRIQRSKVELENNKLKQEQLKNEMEFKNKQLTTQSLSMVQKNEMMMELREKVEGLKKSMSAKDLHDLSHLVDYSLSLDEDWKQFQMHFEDAHSKFYHLLKERFPDLTSNELRLAALVKLNLSIKEMAALMSISPDSVKTARYRLRKKLELNTEDNLTDFMLNMEKEALQAV